MRAIAANLLLWLALIAAPLEFVYAQQTKPMPEIRPMRQIYVQDQRDRGVLLSDSGEATRPDAAIEPPKQLDGKTMSERDAQRRKLVRTLLADGKVTTAQDFHDAAFIFQHGDSSDDYLLEHILAVEAVVKGDSSSKWISAASLDRYLQAIGQKQVFGTQYLDEKYAYYLRHRKDPDLAQKMKDIPAQMTQQPYSDTLMPDTLRLDFCVPGLDQQVENLRAFNNDRYPDKIIPPGCTR